MNRRTMLAAAPAVVAFPVSASQPEDPVLPIFREYREARTEWIRLLSMPEHRNDDTPEAKAASDREQAAFWSIIEETPTSMAGIAAMISVLWDLDGPCVTPDSEDYPHVCSHPNNKIMAAIWRASSGETGLPPEYEPA